jgi:hypothetical protein
MRVGLSRIAIERQRVGVTILHREEKNPRNKPGGFFPGEKPLWNHRGWISVTYPCPQQAVKLPGFFP